MKKKDLPLAILKSLEKFVDLEGDKFEVVTPEKNLLKIIDLDYNSSFHFIIEKYQKKGPNFQVLMSRSPHNENLNDVIHNWIPIDQLYPQFKIWLNLLDQFSNVKSFFDDPKIKSFQDEYYASFEIIDEDDNIKPLKLNQIILLDSYLEHIEVKIDDYKNETNESDLSDIKGNIINLRSNLTSKSKKWVITNLTLIWAKLSKQGVMYIKEFIILSKKEGLTQGAKALINFLKENAIELLTGN